MKKLAFCIIALISFSFPLAQQKDISKYLDKRNDIHTVYESKSSILIRTKENKLELVDLETGEKKNYPVIRLQRVSQSQNNKYVISESLHEKNIRAKIIDKNGMREFSVSTPELSISSNGKYIITRRSYIFGGRFQVFNSTTLEEINFPSISPGMFVSDFIDSNKVLLVYAEVIKQHLDQKYRKIKKENLEKLNKGIISYEEYKKRIKPVKEHFASRRQRGNRKRGAVNKTMKFAILDIPSNTIESEGIIDPNNNYKLLEADAQLAISKNKQLAFLAVNSPKSHGDNSVIEINLATNRIHDISEKLKLDQNSNIIFIDCLENDITLIKHNVVRKCEYIAFDKNNIYRAYLPDSLHFSGIIYTTMENNTIKIFERKNSVHIWNYQEPKDISITKYNYAIINRNRCKMIKK